MPADDRASREAGVDRLSDLRQVRRAVAGALMLVPGGLLVYVAFNAGGFFPQTQDLVALVLAALLAGHLLLSRPGGLRHSRTFWAVIACFGAYTAWIGLSVLWSHAPLRATTEVDLTLVYFLTLALFGSSVTSRRRMRWLVRGLALAAFAVCLVAFMSRALPDVWPIAADLQTPRVSYPVTYWNALGMLAAIGAILCLGLTSDEGEPRVLKGLSALAIPVFAATMLLTFSRGALGAALVGILAYVVLARSRSLPGALVSVIPTTAIAFAVTYRAAALTKPLTDTPGGIAEGRHVALVVGLCALAAAVMRWLLGALDRRLIAVAWRIPLTRSTRRLAAGSVLALACAGALAAGLPGVVSRQYDGFVQGRPAAVSQLRDRLTDPSNNGRIEVWRVAVRQFDSAPLHGTGAGTFVLAWNAQRPRFEPVVNAHSLYFENLGNLGLVGLGLLAALLVIALVAMARRLRGPDRALQAAALAATLTWLIHAGVDWDWQMPVVSLPVFALAGAALAGTRPASERRRPRRRGLLLVAAVLALAILPALDWISESRFQASLDAFTANDCETAVTRARASLEALPFRPDSHMILAYCEMAADQGHAALRDMSTAVAEDPNNWETRYGLAIVQAATGGDPRPEMAVALALNPQYAVIVRSAGYFRDDARKYWAQDAALDLLQVDGSGDRNLVGLRRARTSTAILG